jgi:hypothetical protein
LQRNKAGQLFAAAQELRRSALRFIGVGEEENKMRAKKGGPATILARAERPSVQ